MEAAPGSPLTDVSAPPPAPTLSAATAQQGPATRPLEPCPKLVFNTYLRTRLRERGHLGGERVGISGFSGKLLRLGDQVRV